MPKGDLFLRTGTYDAGSNTAGTLGSAMARSYDPDRGGEVGPGESDGPVKPPSPMPSSAPATQTLRFRGRAPLAGWLSLGPRPTGHDPRVSGS